MKKKILRYSKNIQISLISVMNMTFDASKTQSSLQGQTHLFVVSLRH